jgi:hypothetical protein
MATVDGVTTAPDAHGVVQGDGGAVDRMAGGAGGDRLQGHATFNQYFGYTGNDTFILSDNFAKASGAHDGVSNSFDDQYAYITDFHGAGTSTGEQDFVALQGFTPGTLTLQGTSASGSGGPALIYHYSVQDATGHTFNFMINSLNGIGLSQGDFQYV